MTERFKIGRACFIGGVVCVAIAVLVIPSYWLLGLLGGIAGGFLSGYITFDLAEVRRKVPEALRRAKAKTSHAFVEIAWTITAEVKKWASKPHPFLPLMVVLVGLYLWTVFPLVSDFQAFLPQRNKTLTYFVMVVLAFEWAFFSIIIPAVAFTGLACTGALKVDNVYWPNLLSEKEAKRRGLRQVSLTKLNIYLFAIKGLIYWIIQSCIFLCWRIWKYTAIGLWHAGCFITRFLGHLFKLVHSQQRLLCGVDGTLGGLIALTGFCLYGPATPTTTEYLTVTLFGGLIGAALGIADWELVSKRVFGYGINNA